MEKETIGKPFPERTPGSRPGGRRKPTMITFLAALDARSVAGTPDIPLYSADFLRDFNDPSSLTPDGHRA
jgi:hypothetical protein